MLITSQNELGSSRNRLHVVQLPPCETKLSSVEKRRNLGGNLMNSPYAIVPHFSQSALDSGLDWQFAEKQKTLRHSTTQIDYCEKMSIIFHNKMIVKYSQSTSAELVNYLIVTRTSNAHRRFLAVNIRPCDRHKQLGSIKHEHKTILKPRRTSRRTRLENMHSTMCTSIWFWVLKVHKKYYKYISITSTWGDGRIRKDGWRTATLFHQKLLH